MNLLNFERKKQRKEKISMVTCYDHVFAKIIDQTSIDAVLVGDSLSMIVYGEENTLKATVDIMCKHVEAVKKGISQKPIIGDLPFLSYRKSLDSSLENVEKVIKAGASAVKLEGVLGNEKLITHLVESGVPVMGHLGLTPQFFHQLGGFKVQAKEQKEKEILFNQALKLQELGCFGLVLEMIPFSLARLISEELRIPTIGIGAGPYTDGQILVLHDMLGLNQDFQPRFLRTFLKGKPLIHQALEDYTEAVKSGSFPCRQESYE